MSEVRATAILCSDLHLSHKAPVARMAEDDWYEAMRNVLEEIRAVQGTLPIIFAGDLFDHWNSPPELISFALNNLPDKMYCIPGQHDLPYHSMENVNKSAYAVLVNAQKIHHIEKPAEIGDGICLSPFHWGEDLRPLKASRHRQEIAMVHKYIWIKGKEYKSAPDTNQADSLAEKLIGYDIAVFGDNHNFFHLDGDPKNEIPAIFNGGGLMRRRIDEKGKKRCVGVLYSDNHIETVNLKGADTDKFIEAKDHKIDEPDFTEMIQAYQMLADKGLDFLEVVKRKINEPKLRKMVKDTLIELMESVRG